MTTITTTTTTKAEMTDIEASILKFENRLAASKHIDGKDLGMNYIFPLLRRLAQRSGEQDDMLADLLSSLEDEGGDGESLVDTFKEAHDMLALLGGLLDQTMVVAGFYTVSKAGMTSTDKIPNDLRIAYEQAGVNVQGVVRNIQEAIEDLEADDDDGGDDGGGETVPVTDAEDRPKGVPDAA